VLDALGVGRAHVYGTSMGGKVAQWVAIDHPDRVGALVLGCTTPGGPDGLVAGPEVVGPLAGPTGAARRALAELMVTPRWLEVGVPRPGEEAARVVLEFLARHPLAGSPMTREEALAMRGARALGSAMPPHHGR